MSELDRKNWPTNLVFSTGLTDHLNELNQHLQSETQLNIMFQIIIEVPMKQKL